MNKRLVIAVEAPIAAILLWQAASLCLRLGANRAIAAMVLLLGVLAVATLGDWMLALIASTAASFAFDYYFVDAANSFRITTIEGAITFSAMALTALTGSRLSIRAQKRAEEAILRREEMERLHQLGSVLLAVNSVSEAAESALRKVVELFGVSGAVLKLDGGARVFRAGTFLAAEVSEIPLHTEGRSDRLELFGPLPYGEVQNAIASMISLVLERARSSEERAKIESTKRGEELRVTVLNALAHDFKTPLTSIKAAASTLRASTRIVDEGERDLLVAIDEEADRLNQLIRESLELARIEGRKANPRIEACLVPEIVRGVTAKLERYLGKREYIVDLAEELPPVTGDRFLLEQMLAQVVDNALKYSKPGSGIRISAELADGRMILSVENEGSEIPESERELIFGKFYRGSKDGSRIEGTGLGLAIAKTIAEASGGKVWLDMRPQGPAFRFSLPIAAPGTPATEAAGAKGEEVD